MKIIQIGNVFPTQTRKNPNQGRVYSVKGIAPCLTNLGGGGRIPLILIKGKNEKDLCEKRNEKRMLRDKSGGVLNIAFPESKTRRGRVIDKGETAPTLDTGCEIGQITENLRIRKLTPRECFRLQGIPDEMFERAEFVNSDSQLYKQAGNACTVNVIRAIAERME